MNRCATCSGSCQSRLDCVGQPVTGRSGGADLVTVHHPSEVGAWSHPVGERCRLCRLIADREAERAAARERLAADPDARPFASLVRHVAPLVDQPAPLQTFAGDQDAADAAAFDRGFMREHRRATKHGDAPGNVTTT